MSNGTSIRKQAPDQESGDLRQMLQALHSDILEEVDGKLQKCIDKIVMEHELKHRKPQNGFIEKSSLSKKSRSPKEIPPKEFFSRNSIITNLWQNAEMCSLYNMVFAVFALLYIYIAIFYYLNVQRLKDDIAVVSWNFGQFHIVTATWFAINLSIVCFLYPTFRFWATKRIFVRNKGLYDSMFCTLFILYEATLLIIPARVVIVYNLPLASSLTVVAEQCRLFMKCYAFVRENITKALAYKPHQDGDKDDFDSYPCPKLGKLIYFLFAPTLVYRDNYPRTSHIRWSYVAQNFLQLFGVILGSYIIAIWFTVGIFSRAGIEPIHVVHFVGILAASVPASVAVIFLSFHGSLHCWPNAFAEMLRFGDRMFYGDWWNCTSYAKFHRYWNLIVYDWLYSYIYRDMHNILGISRTGAMLIVFLISAIIHEYMIAVSVKFLLPALFMFFAGFGVIFVFITRRRTSSFWNFFLMFTLFVGYGLLLVFYHLEWYARKNCPRTIDSWQDFFVPRSFYCSLIYFPTIA